MPIRLRNPQTAHDLLRALRVSGINFRQIAIIRQIAALTSALGNLMQQQTSLQSTAQQAASPIRFVTLALQIAVEQAVANFANTISNPPPVVHDAENVIYVTSILQQFGQRTELSNLVDALSAGDFAAAASAAQIASQWVQDMISDWQSDEFFDCANYPQIMQDLMTLQSTINTIANDLAPLPSLNEQISTLEGQINRLEGEIRIDHPVPGQPPPSRPGEPPG